MRVNKTDIKALVIYFAAVMIASNIGSNIISTVIIFTLGILASSSMFYLFDRMDGEI